MLQPKRTKFRKQHKGRIHGSAKAGTQLNFGAFGLKALEPERITAREIEAARRAITRQMKRAGRVWIRVFPDVPVSKKPAEVRMGSGKGAPEYLGGEDQAGPHPVRDRRCRSCDGEGSHAPGRRETFDCDEVRRTHGCLRKTMATRKTTKEKAAPKPRKAKAAKATKATKTSAKTSSKADDFRAKSADELGDQLVKLKKEPSTSASSGPTDSSRRRTACVTSAGPSPASKRF